jgi:hypothetical protein
MSRKSCQSFVSLCTFWVLIILSNVLITRQVINGFSGLMNRFIGQSLAVTTNTYNTSKGHWNTNTQILQHFHSCMLLVRIQWTGLCPISSLLSCSRTGLLLLSRTLQYPISSLLSCSRTGLLLLGRTLQYPLSSLLSCSRTGLLLLSRTLQYPLSSLLSCSRTGLLLLSRTLQYPLSSLLSCSRTGLLLLGRTLQYLISSLQYSPDLRWLHADRICNTPCNGTILLFAAVT